jgi:hypothetical protein
MKFSANAKRNNIPIFFNLKRLAIFYGVNNKKVGDAPNNYGCCSNDERMNKKGCRLPLFTWCIELRRQIQSDLRAARWEQ